MVAAIPTILYDDWSVLFMTALGTMLALITASLREWRLEKYRARPKSTATYAITRGNGYSHVFIIGEPGLYLDDLASAVRKADHATRFASVLLALFWIFFLITAGGLRQHTWYLLGVGLIGMAQNVWVAGRHRSPSANGLPVEIGETFGCKKRGEEVKTLKTKVGGKQVYESSSRRKVMQVLMEVECKRGGVGQALLPEYFPLTLLRDGEKAWWDAAEAHRKSKGRDPMPPLPFQAAVPAFKT